MPTEPVFLRWEHTTPPHCKFYEVEVELSLFFPKRLVRRWGRIGGKRPRSIRMLVADGEELQRPAASGARLPAGAGAAGGGDGGGGGVRGAIPGASAGASAGPKAFGNRRVSTGEQARKYSLPAQGAEIEHY